MPNENEILRTHARHFGRLPPKRGVNGSSEAGTKGNPPPFSLVQVKCQPDEAAQANVVLFFRFLATANESAGVRFDRS
jgi:hypothetical protein